MSTAPAPKAAAKAPPAVAAPPAAKPAVKEFPFPEPVTKGAGVAKKSYVICTC